MNFTIASYYYSLITEYSVIFIILSFVYYMHKIKATVFFLS